MGDVPIKKSSEKYDVIIVGSGAGGGMAGYVLANTGIKVLMLSQQQLEIVIAIAYPLKATSEMHQSAVFLAA